MSYILTDLKNTSDRLQAVKDAIILGYKIDPRDIRYDNLPSLDKMVNAKSNSDRDLIIVERVRLLIDQVGVTTSLKLVVNSITVISGTINLSLNVEDETLTMKL